MLDPGSYRCSSQFPSKESPSNYEPDDARVRAVQNGKLNPCPRQGEPGEVLPGQPSDLTAKALGDKSMTVKRGFGRTCQTQCPARPARYGQG
jgi:hypothetical protein